MLWTLWTLWTLANVAIWKYTKTYQNIFSNYRVKSPFLGHARYGASHHIKQDHGIQDQTRIRGSAYTKVPKGSEYYLTAMGDYPAKILAYDWPVDTSAWKKIEPKQKLLQVYAESTVRGIQMQTISNSHAESHCARVRTAGRIGLTMYVWMQASWSECCGETQLQFRTRHQVCLAASLVCWSTFAYNFE